MALKIRKARKLDIDQMVEIEEANFKERAFSRAQFEGYVKKGHTYVLSFDEIDVIYGYCVVFVRNNSKTARINVVSVDPKFTGKGMGSQILDVVEYIYSQTHEKMQLEVNAKNTGAIALYKRRGYESVEVMRDYYGCGTVGIKMIKNLKPIPF